MDVITYPKGGPDLNELHKQQVMDKSITLTKKEHILRRKWKFPGRDNWIIITLYFSWWILRIITFM